MSDRARLQGAAVVDAGGRVLGTVAAVRVGPEDRRPRWVDIALAGDEARVATVPLQAASADATGRLVLPFSATDLREAPRVTAPVVSAEEADALLRHYGFPPETR